MIDAIVAWLADRPNAESADGLRAAALLAPCPDYLTIAQGKAALVERTGRLGIGGIWGGRQLVFRHFLKFGSKAQRAEWSGRALSVAISEPEVGAHPKRLTTRADPTGTGFRITGRKAWVSDGLDADAIIVFAITAEAQGRKRYSAFILPRATQGLTVTPMPGFHALRPSRHCLLGLEDCQVHASALLGERDTAYERMALPFRDIEDAVGAFGTLGALRYAISQFRSLTLQDTMESPLHVLGAVVALTSVFAAGANAVVATLDQGRLRNGDAALVGLRLLAIDIVDRLRALQPGMAGEGAAIAQVRLAEVIADLDATLSIARGPRLARQTNLGQTVLRSA
jgi:acyl-CoA dehydrogenase